MDAPITRAVARIFLASSARSGYGFTMVKQFLFTRKIGTQAFSVMVACDGMDDAKQIAEKTGMTLEGGNVHTIPCVPIQQFMHFLSSLTFDDRIQWKSHAEEQIEAFLTCGWPENPQDVQAE